VIEEALGQIPISLLASSLYATAAAGLTLNYLVLRYADFALAEYITVGCYVAALLTLSGLDPITAMTTSGLSDATLAFLAHELAAYALGKDAASVRGWALFIGSALAGIAGSLYAFYSQAIFSDDFIPSLTFFVLTMVIVGAWRTTWAPWWEPI
jgi:branched-subunit amino acid ABC-type transport system permease component